MIIDMHAHVGDFRTGKKDKSLPLTFDGLIERLDAEGIDKAVFLPVYGTSPEGTPFGICCGERMSVPDQVVDAGRYRERVIPFGNMDPRWGDNSATTDFSDFLDWFQDHGCKGMGEVTANLPFDDGRVVNMFRQIGERGLLVTIESSSFRSQSYGLQDDPGSPRLEKLLQAAPETVIIGHGPGFWSEIAPDSRAEDKTSYPAGSFSGDGTLARLFRSYPNLYADLSAHSGFNALARNPAYSVRFLNEFQDRLMLGTDIVGVDPSQRAAQQALIDRYVAALLEAIERRGPVDPAASAGLTWGYTLVAQFDYLKALRRNGLLSQMAFDKIAGGNAARLLALA